jgi:uncharacterized protein
MPPRTDVFDLARLRLTSGEARRLDLAVALEPFSFGGERYEALPKEVPVRLDATRTTGNGFALRLRFAAELTGPCMRCLEPAAPSIEVDSREISQPGEVEELRSPYVGEADELDLAAWARDALVLALPDQILCRADCAGLCAICGENLNQAGPDHFHEAEPDPRWAKLRELKLE